MESTTEKVSLECEVKIAASPETVWEFLVDEEKVARWMGQPVTFDARPGGAYRNVVISGHVAAGEFVELDPPHRLVYTFGWEPGDDGPNPVPSGSSTVEIALVAEGDGTLVRLTHSDLPSAGSAESHTHGWDHYLERLAIAATGGAPGADPWLTGQM
jgi:uncharacterized protein YndB with AHSA1/START domain